MGHAAARASRPGFTRATAVRNRSSLGPIPDAETRSGSSRSAQSSDTAAASTASISAIRRSVVSSSVSVTIDFPSRVIRFEVDSIASISRPLMFSFARSSSASGTFPAAMSASCSATIAKQSSRFSSRVPT